MATSVTSFIEYDITIKDLQELMTCKGSEGVRRIQELGGISAICNLLKTSANGGISEIPEDLKRRRQIFGTNIIPQKKPKSFIKLVWEASQNFTLYILDIAALICIILYFYQRADNSIEESSGWIEGVAIFSCVIVVVIVTAFNDYTKEKQFQSLKKQINKGHKFSVVRHGELKQILVDDIVVGDICQVKYGDLLPADGILIHSNDMKVDESTLTGESDHIRKGETSDPMLLSGTFVEEGSGRMLVTAVGINSQVGIIYTLLGITAGTKQKTKKKKHAITKENSSAEKTIEKSKSLLQISLTKLAVKIGYIGTAVAVLSIVILVVRFCIENFAMGDDREWKKSYVNDFLNFFIVGITILVVGIPEGLPLAVTLSLAYSVKKMMKDNNLVRHLDACETMGNVTTICSDKTGTLTTNKMTVIQSYICGMFYVTVPKLYSIPTEVSNLISEAISINTSYTSIVLPSDTISGRAKVTGNKTECALLEFILKFGINYQKIRDEYPEEIFVHVYTFNSSRKSMSTVVPYPGGYQLFSKGASEVLLSKCAFYYNNNGSLRELTLDMKTYLENEVIVPMADNGLRTITIAYRRFTLRREPTLGEVRIQSEPDWDDEEYICNNLTVLCIVGIEDPVRPEVPDAIRKCQRAGITVRMVTGDNIITAKSIAMKCGILVNGDRDEVMTSKEFNRRIKDSNGNVQQYLFDRVWPNLRVLARSSPTDKYILVKGIIESQIKKHHEVVAVTGDGTNDAPALRKADVGFSMGITGTDVAKEASDIIITDDNFSSIVKAIMWGRNVYDSIAKFLQFQLTVTIVAVIVAFIGACAIKDSPLKPVQMLWVNLIMDTLASLALATESPSLDLLLRKPYGRKKPLISQTMMRNIIGQCVYQLLIIFFLLFGGEKLLNIASGRGKKHNAPPTQHFTLVFNTFVMMTLFNEINSRKIHDEPNIFEGILKNYLFGIIWIGSGLSQIIIIEFGDRVFSTHKLELDQWLWCVFFGIGSLIWGQFISIVVSKISKLLLTRKKVVSIFEDEEAEQADVVTRGSILWVHGKTRLVNQLEAIKAFSSSIDIRRSIMEERGVKSK